MSCCHFIKRSIRIWLFHCQLYRLFSSGGCLWFIAFFFFFGRRGRTIDFGNGNIYFSIWKFVMDFPPPFWGVVWRTRSSIQLTFIFSAKKTAFKLYTLPIIWTHRWRPGKVIFRTETLLKYHTLSSLRFIKSFQRQQLNKFNKWKRSYKIQKQLSEFLPSGQVNACWSNWKTIHSITLTMLKK